MSEPLHSTTDASEAYVLKSLEDMRRKLLDLTARNRLLNFPIDKKHSSLRIINELPDQLYQTLAGDQVMQFAPVPDPTKAQLQEQGYLGKDDQQSEVSLKPGPDAKSWAGRLGFKTDFELFTEALPNVSDDEYLLITKARNAIEQYLKDNNGQLSGIRKTKPDLGLPAEKLDVLIQKLGYKDLGDFERETKAGKPLKSSSVQTYLTDNEIQTLHFPAELEALLRSIHGKAQTAIEETGAGILYLALGFLEWYESDDSNKARYAPLFTIPVTLERGKLDPEAGLYRYHLSYTGEDILPNLSLREKLQSDFGLALPALDESMLPEAYFQQVQAMIGKNKPRWSVRRYGALSLLNFSKMLMYIDLDPARWPSGEKNIAHHEVIKRLFTSQSGEEGTSGVSTEYMIDEIDQIHKQFPLIDDADSSQHSALVDAVMGKNLVIEGPPGTGKSQTITNLISAAILNGKKVLFVAEKLAALEVVKTRLDKAGLGDFCLELHSHKSHKRKVLDEIQKRINNSSLNTAPANIDAEIARYEELKNDLNTYAREINQPWESTGITIHKILTGAARYRRMLNIEPQDLHIEGLSGQKLDHIAQLRLKDQVDSFVKVVSEFRAQVGEHAQLSDHPWYGVNNLEIQLFDSNRIVAGLQQWQAALTTWQNCLNDFLEKYALSKEQLTTLTLQQQLVDDSALLPVLSESLNFSAFKRLDEENKYQLKTWLQDFEVVQSAYEEMVNYLVADKLKALEGSVVIPEFADIHKAFGIPENNSLGDVARLILSIEQLNSAFEHHWTQLSDLMVSLPAVMSSKMNSDLQGFKHIVELIELAGEISPELLKHRHERFDDDEIDGVLDKLAGHITPLLSTREALKVHFKLNSLPDEEELKNIESELARSGMFSWLSGSWRQAKQSLLNLSQGVNVPWKTLFQHLPQLRQYMAGSLALEQANFSRELGDCYQGIDTPLDNLQKLRKWYKNVRSTWGVGFGPNVALGSALLTLDSQLIKGIHQLRLQGVADNINASISKLSELYLLLPNIEALKDADMAMVGDNTGLKVTREKLVGALSPLQQWFRHEAMSLRDAKDKAVLLHELQQVQTQLKAKSLPEELFDPQEQLYFGFQKKNDYALSVILGTLAFDDAIQQAIKSEDLIGVIKSLEEKKQLNGLYEDLSRFNTLWKNHLSQREQFVAETQLDIEQWQFRCNDSLGDLIARNDEAIAKPRWLNGWLNFNRVAKGISEQGLQSIQNAVFSRMLPIEQVETGLMMTIYDQLAREVVAAHPHLVRISGNQRSVSQQTFRIYDKKLKSLQRQRIASTIARNQIPQGSSGGKKSEYTELALIKNELGKKMRHIPIRQLINRAGRALIQLKPCFMMGPMSAANYLQPGEIEFDLVVMDEASQVKPEDALGVIARGKQIVVVGDPKQLPPTSFFDRADSDDDEDEDTAAVSLTDSILDASLPLFPMRRLRWHYRSQHEDLIAYSNRNFYDSDLVVFPSPNAQSEEYGIKFSYVKNGRFVNQHNIEEARVIALAVAQHAEKYPQQSLGVVAMNSKQRDQIERAVDELCRENPQMEVAIGKLRTHADPLFIKNLENVQGDERDVIFISFTYGPGEAGGRVFQRFGPINSDVGWRRLNVLFTRSRKRMHVFSSMHADDIQVAESTKRGVKALRGFLHFAEKGNMDGVGISTGKAPDSDFEISVIEALKIAGFDCEPQVGVAGFFIDIAVRDPGKPGRYLMGIECDGATYHSAKSARDRDRLRQEVLERLGWKISRIWSTDWFSNPDEVLGPIIRELNQLKTPITAASVIVEEQFSDVLVDDKSDKAKGITGYNDISESLHSRLERFAQEIIAAEFPDVSSEHRLLRQSMIEALVEHQPLSKSEFVERIPKYLRDATEPQESRMFLDTVLEIIDGHTVMVDF
ncbi:DUF4011 domain-containing anti-phage protein Hhe [Tatumella citrea]|uniref:DNA helicase UvrD n=1 Tax=Tatumella citrea TaxID=53336 RepID=A0A1Y0L513_TATCI|nr:DNA helicase UvrD [Tatumella citrea]ARU96806.1 DNA helicase UvrD [Tatumella citrea]